MDNDNFCSFTLVFCGILIVARFFCSVIVGNWGVGLSLLLTLGFGALGFFALFPENAELVIAFEVLAGGWVRLSGVEDEGEEGGGRTYNSSFG